MLLETEYQYRTSLYRDISPYLGKNYFIHFGDSPKVGVNPKKFHADISGVYCYSLDWLVEQERFINGNQFAVGRKYWTIIRLKPDEHGITLSQFTEDDLKALAQKNQWPKELWDSFYDDRMQQYQLTPGALLWKWLNHVSIATRSFSPDRAIKGVSYIYDDGRGVIHPGEANQIVFINPRSYEIVDSGVQNKGNGGPLGEDSYEIVQILKRLRGEHGGTLLWKGKLPTLTFETKGAVFTVSWKQWAGDGSLILDAKWGRTGVQFPFSAAILRKESMDNLLAMFRTQIERISVMAAAKRDIFFTPYRDEKDCRADIHSIIDVKGSDISTTVDNRYKSMTVSAYKTAIFGKSTIETIVNVTSKQDSVGYSVYVKINGHHLTVGKSTNTADDLLDDLSNHFDLAVGSLATQTSYGIRNFYHNDDVTAFIGLVIKSTGIYSLMEMYSEQIAFWDSYQYKESLLTDIKRMF